MILPNRHFSPLKLVVDRDRHVAIMLNPKVLTQFTRHFLKEGYRKFRNREDPSESRYRLLKAAREMPVAPLSDYLHFLRNAPDYRLYGLVRNPYGRLVSAWKNKFLDPYERALVRDDNCYPKSVRKRHIKHIRAFASERGLEGASPADPVPFRTFLLYATGHQSGRRDHHWSPQVEVLMADRLPYTRLFKFEGELAEAVETLAEALGFDPEWAREALGDKRNASEDAGRYFDDETARISEAICSRDCEFFGYPADSWRSF